MKDRKQKTFISLNFDSMNEALGFPGTNSFRDASYFEVFDRFVSCIGPEVPLTIFIIGKDLEDKKIAKRVAEWADSGHEIANHTYRHLQEFGTLDDEQTRSEIWKSHDLIAKTTGCEPKGFIAPGWSMPRSGIDVLVELGYQYDLSGFNSPWIVPLTAKLIFNELRCGELLKPFQTIRRRDYISCISASQTVSRLFSSKRANTHGFVWHLPLPKSGRFSLPIWHTAGFFFGFDALANQVMKYQGDAFYYTIHPADFFEEADFKFDKLSTHLERMNLPVEKKLVALSEIFQILKAKYEIITGSQLVSELS